MRTIILLFSLLISVIPQLSARVPCMINYQGKILQSGVPISGSHNIIFRIYDAAVAGSLLWSGDVQTIHITNGLFSSYVGESTSMGSPDAFSNINWGGGDRYL
ncbi:MAG: hypothetical protein PHF84_10420, partial [bacterium]|nr:hypothetical protein [bacterium]